MTQNTCYIFAAGDFCGHIQKKDNDIIIAADAGFHHLEKLQLTPDILLGDFDSIGKLPSGIETVKFPAEKDCTDTELAIIEGIKHGYLKFVVCGAIGGKRPEHTIANLMLASCYASKGFDITLTDGENIVKAVHNSYISFTEKETGYLSIFSLGGNASGVSIEGLKYPLKNAVINSSTPTLCVSNEFLGKESKIKVECGTIIIMYKGRDFE